MTEQALLQAILDNPDDDAPRLVYADWLDEHGEDAHAELIRLQCRLAHLPRDSPETRQLALRIGALKQGLTYWLGLRSAVEVRWGRGFVDRITTGMLNYLDHAGRLARYAPALELVLVRDARDDAEMEALDFDEQDAVFERFAACLHLTSCVSLDLSRYCPGMEGLQRILSSPHLTNLRRLDAPDNEAGPAVEAVACPTFARLTWANFHNSDSAADCPDITPLVTCPHLANLEYLDFGECEQGDPGLRALAASPHMARLRHLNVSTSQFSPEAIRELANAPHLTALTELDLSGTFGSFGRRDRPGQGDVHLLHLADSPLIEQLTHLWLGGNEISDAGVRVLAGSPRRLRLKFLDLRGNAIGPAGRAALRERFGEYVCSFGES